MPKHIIRTVRLAHCKKGPLSCAQCRKMEAGRICLLDIDPPRPGEIQRRVIEVGRKGQGRWLEYDIVRAFESAEEARNYARMNGVEDIEV